MKKLYLLLLSFLFVTSGWALDVDPMTQNPVITNTDLQVKVIYNPASNIYEYQYTLASGGNNLGYIQRLAIDVSTLVPQGNVYDPVLYSDATRSDKPSDEVGASKNSVPIGMQSPGPNTLWFSAVSMNGTAFWGAINDSAFITPGQTLGSFIFQSKAPPGARRFSIMPYFRYDGFPCADECPDGVGPNPESYKFTGTTIGPVLPEELKLINGKGQSAAVNAFLAYSNITATRITLPATAKGFDLAVKYGTTTLPATFAATLNGVNVTPSFHPNPGAFDVVRIPLAKGTHKLLLSIEGLKPSGAQSRDTDSLTFIVP
ncbi:MAG: hypothetical protein ABIR48_01995 [Gammaproteobacteria bacterium]